MGGLGQTLSLIFEINADPNHAITALQLFEGEVARRMGFSEKSFHQFNMAVVEAGKDLAYIGAGVGVVGAALFAAAERAAHFAEQIGHVSEKSGATVEQVSTLKFAADRVGVSFGAVDKGLGFLAKNLGNLGEMGGAKAAKALADLGVQALNADGSLKPVSELLPTILERLGKLDNGAIKTADSVALFGRGGKELIPALNAMREGFKQVEDRARAMGLVIGEDDVRASRVFLLEQRTLTAEVNAFALIIGRDLMPIITQLFIRLEHFPLVLDNIKLRLLQIAAVTGAVATYGASLMALIPLHKALNENEEKMNQVLTEGLVKLDAEARAALAAGIAVDGHAGSTEKAHKQTKEWSIDLGALASIYRELIKEQDPFTRANEEYRQVLMRIAVATGPTYNAFMLEKMALERRDKDILDDLLKRHKAIEAIFPNEPPKLPASSQLPPAIVEWDKRIPSLTRGAKDMNLEFGLTINRLQRQFPQAAGVAGLAMAEFRSDLKISGVTLNQFSQAMGANVAQAIVYGNSIGEAMRLAMKATLASVAGEAIVRALYSTGLGFYLLAIQDYRGAALAFKSAAIFGTIGGAAAGIGAAVPGGNSKVAGPGAGGGGGTTTAAGAPSTQAVGGQQSSGVRNYFIFQGPIYGGQAGLDELASKVSVAVKERDLGMTSYTSVRKTTRRA